MNRTASSAITRILVLVALSALLFQFALRAEEPADMLLAHWTFDEEKQAETAANKIDAATYEAKLEGAVSGARGVFGNALELQGNHAVRMDRFGTPTMDAITLSAWCLTTTLGGFREILRQESGHRLLFSFQGDGTILSLGLDIGGYVECDGTIDPSSVLDGGWHHCAATFNGGVMRVFLDGRKVGALERPGHIALQPDVSAFIGSSGGNNEHFQGRLDDLRVYGCALNPKQVKALFDAGDEVLKERRRLAEEQVQRVYKPTPTFAETLAVTRRNALENREHLEEEYAEALAARIKTDFPEASENFTAWSGRSPVAYIMTAGNSFHYESVGRLVELLLEYKPLTEAQWAKTSSEEQQQWQDAEQLQQRYEGLRETGLESRFSPEWIELILEMGARIDFRPTVQEAVAPMCRLPRRRREHAPRKRRDAFLNRTGSIRWTGIPTAWRYVRKSAGCANLPHASCACIRK